MERAHEWADKARRWSARPGAWLVLLVVVALIYYGSYYRSSLNFRDEGGTMVLGAKRLLEGQRPFIDVVLNYNVMWFYPVVGLFKLFGVSMTVVRVYCFALATLTAVLAFLGVQKVSRRPWLAFLVGLLLVLAPGMTFKNYMPLLAVANSVCLLWFVNPRPCRSGLAEDLEEEAAGLGRPFARLVVGSVVLGVTWLIRIDLGMFFSLLWLGALVLQTLDRSRTRAQRLTLLVAGPVVATVLVCGVHMPVYLDAKARGFEEKFVEQYVLWPKRLMLEGMKRLGIEQRPARALPAKRSKEEREKRKAARAERAARAQQALAAPEKVPEPAKTNQQILKRKSWSDAFTEGKWKDRLLAVLLYAPLLTLVPLVLWAVLRIFAAIRDPEPGAARRPTAALLMLGGALTVFPQYFFFRPDGPHLSEFSPGFWLATVSGCLLLGASSIRRVHNRQWIGGIFLAVLTIHACFFLSWALNYRWAGTIDARKKRTQEFQAANGVHVYVTKTEKLGLEALKKVISEHSKPGEYLVAYPYHPTINVLADRPTYEPNVYIDNAERDADWETNTIEKFLKYQPAVIAISEWAINGTDESRFSTWAPKVKTWIQKNYTYQGTYLESEKFEIYTRPEKPL